MGKGIFPLLGYSQKVLPAVFDDSLSYYEVVSKVRDKLNETIKKVNTDSDSLSQLIETVNDLNKLLDSIADGKYADLYLKQLSSYIDDNLINFVARLAYYLFPSLSYDDNRKTWRYALKIPSSWKWLKFTYIWDDDRKAWFIGLKY